nr:unnamed protein product [Spirometra erinaceieuropaei]
MLLSKRTREDIGELYLGSSLDYERASRHFLTVEARDGGSPSLSTTTVATINVIDVNDNRPRFIRQQAYPLDNVSSTGSGSLVPTGVFVFEIPENTPEGTQFGRLGSQSLVARAHDNGLTALRTSVPVTVHVVRQSDLPPAIVSSNTTLTFYRGPLAYWARREQMGRPFPALTRVTVKDRTAYDRLVFELLPNDSPATNFFHIDTYDGTVRIRPSASLPNQSETGRRGPRDPEMALLESQLVLFSPLAKLESGTYHLRVRVTNNSLSAEGTISINLVGITEEMLESACVFHIADLYPNEFFMQRYDEIIRRELSRALLRTSATGETEVESNVFLLSVQATSNAESGGSNRPKRSPTASSSPRGVDVLLSVYDPPERQFIESGHLVQRIHAMQSNLSGVLRHSVHAYNSLCAQKVLLGADLVHGFRPLADFLYPEDWLATQHPEQQPDRTSVSSPIWPQFNYSGPPPVFRSGLVGESSGCVCAHVCVLLLLLLLHLTTRICTEASTSADLIVWVHEV